MRIITLSIAVFFLFINTSLVFGEPAYGDAIVAGSIGDASTLVPILASDSASQDIVGLVFNGLLKYDKNIKTGWGSGRIMGSLF